MALKPLGDALDGILKLGWSHGPLGCCGDCSCSGVPFKTALVGCHFPCCQFGITEKALGHNCIVGCCFAAYCTHCAAYTQRRHIKKGDLLTDLLLACCCPHCVIMQNANQVGESATYSHWKLADLLKPPTAQDIKNEVKDVANDATSGL